MPRKGIITAVRIILLAIIFLLALDNRRLRLELRNLRETPNRGEGSNDPAPTVQSRPYSEEDQKEKLELMRLRAEITELRRKALHKRNDDALRANGEQTETAEYSPPIPVETWRNVGTSTPEESVQSLFWFLREARNGGDLVDLIKGSPHVIRYHSGEDLNEYPTLTTELSSLLIEGVDQIVSIQLGKELLTGSHEAPNDVVTKVKFNLADGSTHSETVTLAPTFVGSQRNADGGRDPIGWSSRIYVRMVQNKPKASFKPIPKN